MSYIFNLWIYMVVFVCCWCPETTDATTTLLPVPSPQFPDLQSAINAANDGDEIRIQSGIFYSFCGVVVSVQSNLTITGSGEQATVLDCSKASSSSSRAITITSPNAIFTLAYLTIQNGVAQHGGAVAVVGPSLVSATVSNCAFINNTAIGSGSVDGGGALYISGNNYAAVAVQNCDFISNTANPSAQAGGGGFCLFFANNVVGCSVVVTGCKFAKNSGMNGGGGLVLDFNNNVWNTSMVLQGGQYIQNTAQFSGGGGVQVWVQGNAYNSNIKIIDSDFSFNSAPQGGGGIYIGINGEAINSSAVVDGGTFLRNQALQNGGGATQILIQGVSMFSKLLVRNGNYTLNTAEFSGGAAVLRFNSYVFNSEVVVEGGTFMRNFALFGGAAAVWLNENAYNSTVTVKEGWYAFNSGQLGGGTFVLFNENMFNSRIYVGGCSYLQNQAVGQGGGLLVIIEGRAHNNTVAIQDGSFILNSAKQDGGGGGGLQLICLSNVVSSTTFLIQNASFGNNLAPQGGGASLTFWNKGYDVSITVNNVDFVGNSAFLGNGGGISVLFLCQNQTTFTATIEISQCTFASNNASSLGGGILAILPPGSPITTDCITCQQSHSQYLPPSNPKCNFPQSSRYCNQAQFGNVFMQSYFVPYSQQATLHVVNVSFIGNSVSEMGGAMVASNGLLKLTNITCVDNLADQQAGAFYCTGTAEISLNGSVYLRHNTAGQAQTSLLMNSLGKVQVEREAVVTIESKPPPKFIVDKGQFEATALLETGNVVYDGFFQIKCPPGFQHQATPIQNVSVFVSGWPNAMLAQTRSVSCDACGVNFYSMEGGYLSVMGEKVSIYGGTCNPCPFGANCSQGMNIVLATKNYWGQLSSDSKTWKFARCSLGYCCQNDEGCQPQSQDDGACAFGRDVNSPLCGSCLQGYSQNLRGAGCSLNENCTDGRWFWVALVALAVVWCVLLLWASPASIFPRIYEQEKKKRDYTWVIPILLFFFQNVYFLFMVQGGWPSTIVSVITSITNMHLNGKYNGDAKLNWTNMCVIKDLTTLASIALELLIPALIFGLLLTYHGIALYLHKTREMSNWLRRTGPSAMKTVLISYSLIVSVCGSLLHCVEIGDDIRVVFRAGSVVCGQTLWQKGVWAVFGLVVLPFPALLFGFQIFVRQKKIISNVVLSIEKPYLPSRWYWPSLVLLRRLMIALVYSFIDDPASQGIWFCILFVSFLVSQLLLAPHKTAQGNVVETMSLVVLTIVSLCTLRTGSYFEANVMLDSVPSASHLTAILNAVQTLLFFVPVVVTLILALWQWVVDKFELDTSVFKAFAKKRFIRLKISDGAELASYLLEKEERVSDHDDAQSKVAMLQRQLEEETKEKEKARRERDAAEAKYHALCQQTKQSKEIVA